MEEDEEEEEEESDLHSKHPSLLTSHLSKPLPTQPHTSSSPINSPHVQKEQVGAGLQQYRKKGSGPWY